MGLDADILIENEPRKSPKMICHIQIKEGRGKVIGGSSNGCDRLD